MTTPLGGPYTDRATAKRRAGIPDSNTTQDADIDAALLSAADTIHKYTGRQFGRADTVSTRSVYWTGGHLDTDDFWTTTGLSIGGVAWVDGNTSYVLEPADGVVNGVPGWPYERISRYHGAHPIYAALGGHWNAPVLVTAMWGWEAVPAGITQASLLLVADHLKIKDAPFGVAGFGDYVVRVRSNPRVAELLDPCVRDKIKVA